MDPKIKRKKEKEEKVRLTEAFEEFRETFEEGTTGAAKPKTFIRGDIVNADAATLASPDVYKPAPIQLKPLPKSLPTKPPAMEAARKLAQETAKKIMMEASDKGTPKMAVIAPPFVPPPSKPPKPGTKKVVEKPRMSNLETFKEELKQMQAMRDERKGLRQHLKERLNMPEEELDRIAPSLEAPYGQAGTDPFGEDDPNTTNLYVCNLPADAQLEDFFATFGSFGPLASARILHPRPEEERRYRDTLSGFVAFMSRMDAERAKCAMHQETMRGCELRVSWARPVNMPPLPFFVPLPLRDLALPDPPSSLPFNARPLSDELRAFLQNYGDLPKLGAPLGDEDLQMLDDYKKMIENATVRVVIPTEKPLLFLIHRVIEFLVRSGPLFEAILMARERQNPMYRFLFDNHHPTHVYYRWRLYMVLQGDDRQKWRLDKFKMFDGGSWWQPPPHALFEQGMPPQLYDSAYVPRRRRDKPYEKRVAAPRRRSRSRHRSGDSSEEEDKEKRHEKRRSRGAELEREREERKRKMRGILAEGDREELEELLRNLAPEKVTVGDAMMWCVDHAECAKEITQCIFESLCIKETPLHKKIARIYLVSDILANCSARIKDVFYYRQHFGDLLLKIFVELNETLEGIESRLKAEQFRQRVMLCFRNWEDNAVYPTDLLIQCQNVFLGLIKIDAADEAVETSSIDGEPMSSDWAGNDGDDLDGEPMTEDGQGEEDIDGIPMVTEAEEEQEEEDIDGMPMEEGGDGREEEKQHKMGGNVESDNRFTVGSWSTVEIDEVVHVDEKSDNIKDDEEMALTTEKTTKSKWESIDLHSRWDRGEGIAREFAQQQQDEDQQESPRRKKHKLSRLSPDAERSTLEKHRSNGGGAVADDTHSVSGSNYSVAVDDEDRRRILREIEVKVVKLQDELESDGAKSGAEISAELAKYRQRLMTKMEGKLRDKDERKREHWKGRERAVKERETDRDKEDRDREERGGGRRRESLNGRREDREREKERERDRERDGEREKGRRELSRERERDRQRDRSRERRREHRSDRDDGRRTPDRRRR